MVTDPASLDSATVATSLPPSRNSKTSRRLHEPFVSREFGASAGKGSLQLNGVVDRNSQGRSSTALALRTTGDASDQAAPLYTVNAVRTDSGGALVARPSPLTDSVLLGKRMSVAEAGCLSVGGSALGTALVPAGLKGAQFKSKPNDAPCTSSGQIEARSTMASPLRSPQDISSLVTDAVCTWGQELGTVLGQAALDSAPPSSRQDGCWSSNRPGLTTTGLFPHTMILRYALGLLRLGCISICCDISFACRVCCIDGYELEPAREVCVPTFEFALCPVSGFRAPFTLLRCTCGRALCCVSL